MTQSSVFDPRIGTYVAGYRIEGLLGRGGMSVAYLAEDLRLERKVALKILVPELSEDSRFRERFLRESKLAASIDHPNIVPIYEAGETDGLLYIAMRYVEGSDLKAVLAQRKLAPDRTLALVERLADALDRAHAKGLVHRDVKPGNILLADGSDDGYSLSVYLSDFGLTKHTADEASLTDPSDFLGTLDYVAPEQIEGERISAQTDLYSLTCVLYQCLTGEVAFKRATRLALLWAHLEDPPPKPSRVDAGLPEGLDDVIATGMAKRPDQRYRSCRELVDQARMELGIMSGPPESSGKKRGLRIGLLAVALTTAAAVLVLVLVRGDAIGREATPLGIEPSSLVRIDPRTNEVIAAVRVGRQPHDIEVGHDAAWVGNLGDRTVSRVDNEGNSLTSTVAVGHVPTAVAVGDDAVWVAGASGGVGRLTDLDPRTGRVRRSFELNRSDPIAVAAGGDDVWVAANDTVRGPAVLRVAPETGKPVATIPLPPRSAQDPVTGAFYSATNTPWDIAAGAGAVWLVSGHDSPNTVVSRIDPASNEIVQEVELANAFSIAVVDGEVWVSGPGQETSRIDPATGQVSASVSVPAIGELNAGQDALWITHFTASNNYVTRVDTAQQRIVAVVELQPLAEFNPKTNRVGAGAGTVWVSVQ